MAEIHLLDDDRQGNLENAKHLQKTIIKTRNHLPSSATSPCTATSRGTSPPNSNTRPTANEIYKASMSVKYEEACLDDTSSAIAPQLSAY